MARSDRFVGVTFGELAAWHASGETRLLRGRLIDVPIDSNAPARSVRDGFPVRTLLQRLPPLSLDDEEGVLIVKLASGQLSDDEEDSQLVRISMDLVEGVVPLTERARQISGIVGATDALALLRVAVGMGGVLDCDPCE